MKPYQQEFLEFAIHIGVLRFGEFTLKSGRNSPYFFNSGLFDHGASLATLGRFYAKTIIDSNIQFDTLFGPAYKGIPLASSTAIALADHHQLDIPYAFNRKEAKDHGEGGHVVGAPLKGRVLIIDDVVSAGTSVRESVELIQSAGAIPAGVVIALDRQERGKEAVSAIQEIEMNYKMPVAAIICLDNLVEFLRSKSEVSPNLDAIQAYRDQYGT